MSGSDQLTVRIDGVIAATKDKLKQAQQEALHDYRERQKRLELYSANLPKILDVAKPRLELLAKRFGERVEVTPSVSGNTRSARFAFKSPLAHITMATSAYPDREVANFIVEYNLQIVPILMQFESQSQFVTPIASPDTSALEKWLDDRLVGFVETYMKMHENEYYTKDQYVEDPVAQLKFPKFAAGATLEHGGQTYYFIDETTKAEFEKQRGIAVA